MKTNTSTFNHEEGQPSSWWNKLSFLCRTYFRGAGQVMFQCSAWTGLFFLLGIFWGAYHAGMPAVAWGAAVGLAASTIGGYSLKTNLPDGEEGLWGFNGILVGCAFPTFLGNTWLMWVALIFCSMLTTWMRRGFNNVTAQWKINSLTFPFVALTWVFLLCSRIMPGLAPDALSTPELVEKFSWGLDTSFPALIDYWLRGVSQVFLIDNPITGLLFLAGLALCNGWAALYGALGSAISLALAILFHANPADISAGLFGFSPVLTGIAIGMTFYKVNWKSCFWAIAAIVATFFIQGAADVFMEPFGLPTLTAPFCVATWLFLLPLYQFDNNAHPDHTVWHSLPRRLRPKNSKNKTPGK